MGILRYWSCWSKLTSLLYLNYRGLCLPLVTVMHILWLVSICYNISKEPKIWEICAQDLNAVDSGSVTVLILCADMWILTGQVAQIVAGLRLGTF